MAKSLALFDFDGTLTTRDSLGDFIYFVFGLPKTLLGGVVLSPYLAGYVFKFMKNDTAKQHVTRYFFGGKMLSEMQLLGARYAAQRIPQILRPEGIAKIKWHQQQGHRVVIVSASADIWLKPWTDAMGMELISTRLTMDGDTIIGDFDGGNCHGEEKVKRIKQAIDLTEFGEVYAYGDTSGDKPMLALAGHAFYKPFR